MDTLSSQPHGTTFRLGSDDSWEEKENIIPVLSSSLDAREELLLKLFHEENTLVKVIQNNDWKQFIDRLAADEQDVGLKTSTTMIPSDGRLMRLYGKTYQYSVGFVWNLNEIESSVCWCWPAGFYAKTEFNFDPVTNRLSKGLQEALVSLEQLHINNAQLLATANNSPSSSTTSSTEVSFNEVFATVTVRLDKQYSYTHKRTNKQTNKHTLNTPHLFVSYTLPLSSLMHLTNNTPTTHLLTPIPTLRCDHWWVSSVDPENTNIYC